MAGDVVLELGAAVLPEHRAAQDLVGGPAHGRGPGQARVGQALDPWWRVADGALAQPPGVAVFRRGVAPEVARPLERLDELHAFLVAAARCDVMAEARVLSGERLGRDRAVHQLRTAGAQGEVHPGSRAASSRSGASKLRRKPSWPMKKRTLRVADCSPWESARTLAVWRHLAQRAAGKRQAFRRSRRT